MPAGGSDNEGDGALRIDETESNGLEPETLLDEQVGGVAAAATVGLTQAIPAAGLAR